MCYAAAPRNPLADGTPNLARDENDANGTAGSSTERDRAARRSMVDVIAAEVAETGRWLEKDHLDEAVMAALRALSQLETGKVALSGLAVTIEGVAPDQGTAVAVSYQLRRDLPRLFSTSESIKWKQASASRDVAATVVPRIKAYVETNGEWADGKLPPLSPPRDAR